MEKYYIPILFESYLPFYELLDNKMYFILAWGAKLLFTCYELFSNYFRFEIMILTVLCWLRPILHRNNNFFLFLSKINVWEDFIGILRTKIISTTKNVPKFKFISYHQSYRLSFFIWTGFQLDDFKIFLIVLITVTLKTLRYVIEVFIPKMPLEVKFRTYLIKTSK